MSRDVACVTAEDVSGIAHAMAESLAAGREFAVWVADGSGDARMAYSIRHEGGAYRLRDADLNDVAVFGDAGAALRFGARMMESTRWCRTAPPLPRPTPPMRDESATS